MNGGDSLYRAAMPDRISLRRLIQQSAYLSDSQMGRRITRNFCARYRLPNGKRRIRNCYRNRGNSSSIQHEDAYGVRALDLGLNPEAFRALGEKANAVVASLRTMTASPPSPLHGAGLLTPRLA